MELRSTSRRAIESFVAFCHTIYEESHMQQEMIASTTVVKRTIDHAESEKIGLAICDDDAEAIRETMLLEPLIGN